MPELPEAENIRRALQRLLPGRVIEKVEVFTPAMREPLTPLLSAGLEGHRFGEIRRRGRYVVAELDDRRALLMHFGMSGVVRVEPEGMMRRKHEHVFLHLSGDKVFKFECTRRFSVLKLCCLKSPGAWPVELAELGPEPLENLFTGAYFWNVARNRKLPVKNLLMDNAAVVGVGNIYATESLFAAGINPLRSADSLTKKECEVLVSEVRRILQRAIEAGGSSISDFLNVDGSEGKFAQELLVYGRCNDRCFRCGSVLQSVKIGGRSSCFCPKCQK